MASTLYVTQQGAVLCRTGERIIVKKHDEILADIPAIEVEQIVIYGNTQVTTPLMAFLLDRGIDTVFLSSHGIFRGRLQPEFSRNVTLRQKQYQLAAHSPARLEVARQLIVGKIRNCLSVCRRHPVEHPDRLMRYARQAAGADDMEQLRGFEGSASRAYFEMMGQIIHPPWKFTGRVKHPPTDPVNVLFSLGYTLLFKDIYAWVNIVGLDPYQGVFHDAHVGHPALVSDLMEEFRAPMVDRLVLRLLHKSIIKPCHFSGRGANIRLKKDGLTLMVTHYRTQRDSRLKHLRLGVNLTLYQCMEEQVRLFARVVLGTEAPYQPFLME